MIVAVGSQNAAKIKAVKDTFQGTGFSEISIVKGRCTIWSKRDAVFGS